MEIWNHDVDKTFGIDVIEPYVECHILDGLLNGCCTDLKNDIHIAHHTICISSYYRTSGLEFEKLVTSFYSEHHGLCYSAAYRYIVVIYQYIYICNILQYSNYLVGTSNIVICTRFSNRKGWRRFSFQKCWRHCLLENCVHIIIVFPQMFSPHNTLVSANYCIIKLLNICASI